MNATTVRTMLENAGWELTSRGRAMQLAELAYAGGGMELKVRHEPDEDAWYLTLTEPEGRKLTLRVPCDDALDRLLQLLVSRQDDLDISNYNAFVNEVVRVSPATQGLRDGQLVDLEAD